LTSLISSKNQVGEIRALTGLRGIAALYVIILHYFAPLPLTTHLLCFLGHGYLAVDLFFTLSGFVLALNYADRFASRFDISGYVTFLCRRFGRIYPLYLFSLLAATILVERGLLPLYGRSISATFWSNLFLIQNWGNWASMDFPAWSISVEWCAYLLFPLLLKLPTRSVRGMWSVALLCTLSLCGVTLFSYTHAGWPKLLDKGSGFPSLVRCVTEFSLGIVAFRISFTPFGEQLKNNFGAPASVLLGILVLLAFRGTDLVLALLFPWLIISLTGRVTPLSRFLGCKPIEYLGLLSFSLYLIHPLLSSAINFLDQRLKRGEFRHSHTIAVVIILPLLFLCSTVTFYGIEIPVRRRFHDLLATRRFSKQQIAS